MTGEDLVNKNVGINVYSAAKYYDVGDKKMNASSPMDEATRICIASQV